MRGVGGDSHVNHAASTILPGKHRRERSQAVTVVGHPRTDGSSVISSSQEVGFGDSVTYLGMCNAVESSPVLVRLLWPNHR